MTVVLKSSEDFVVAELDDHGGVELSLWFSDAGPLPDNLEAAVQYWTEGDGRGETAFQPVFRLKSAVDYVVEGHENGKGGPIDPEAKPLLDALRAEFMAQVARIDALVYEDD